MVTYLLVRHCVADFPNWKTSYEKHGSARAAAGLKEKEVLHDLDAPNQIVLLFEVSDVQKAKEFSKSASLQDAMRDAGVTDKPDIYFLQD